MTSNASRTASPQQTGKGSIEERRSGGRQTSVIGSGGGIKEGGTFLTSMLGVGGGDEAVPAWQKKIDDASKDLGNYIEGMNSKLNAMLLQQEQECLSAVSLHWNRKHSQIVSLIEKIHAKNSNQSAKDERILALESKINFLSNEATRLSQALIKQKNETTRMKTKVDTLRDDSRFFEKQVKDTKRQNKLLKLALTRLQGQLAEATRLEGGSQLQKLHDLLHSAEEDEANIDRSLVQDMSPTKTILEADSLLFPTEVILEDSVVKKQEKQISPIGKSVQQGSHTFRAIPTENVKFTIFLDTLFSVELSSDEAKIEIVRFVQNLETRYSEKIKEQRIAIERLKGQIRKLKSVETNQVTQKNQLEVIFVDAVEEVRKEIMRRRMKNQVATKKKFRGFETKNAEEAAQFEQSLLKLANLAKKRIKYDDFTSTDKFNIIDLFVNNEQTLLKIYESLFPHRASQIPTAPVAADKSHYSSGRNFSAAPASSKALIQPNPSSSEILALNKSSIKDLEKQTSGYDPSSASAGFLPAIKSKGMIPAATAPQHKQQTRSLSRPHPGNRVITGRAPPGINASLDAGVSHSTDPAVDPMGVTGQRTPMVPRPEKKRNPGKLETNKQAIKTKHREHLSPDEEEDCMSVSSYQQQQMRSSFNN